jgi:hypothetical protein
VCVGASWYHGWCGKSEGEPGLALSSAMQAGVS